MPLVQVYSRPGCHLCELLLEELLPLLRGRVRLQVRNIDEDPALQQAFGARIPVVEIGGRVVCELKLDMDAVESALEERENTGGHS